MDEIEDEIVLERVKKYLQKKSRHAYSRAGLMIEVFAFRNKELNASFEEWPKDAQTLYVRIGRAMKTLEHKGLIKISKHGKTCLYRWKSKE